MTAGQLYLIATPIGHLSDITLRAIDTLKSVDWIAAEDTRHSQRLLSHYQITTSLFSLHEYNEDDRIQKILGLLSEGKSVGLISDAGTPLISDPGFRLVRSVRAAGFAVVPVPGPCAAIAALIASGLPTDRFVFEGFVPAKKSALRSYLLGLKEESRTMIFYESVHRVVNTLSIFCEIFGEDRVATIARELTKTYETIKQDKLITLSEWIKADGNQQKGEFVIVLQGAKLSDLSADEAELVRILKILMQSVSVKDAVKLACEITGLNRKIVYKTALELDR